MPFTPHLHKAIPDHFAITHSMEHCVGSSPTETKAEVLVAIHNRISSCSLWLAHLVTSRIVPLVFTVVCAALIRTNVWNVGCTRANCCWCEKMLKIFSSAWLQHFCFISSCPTCRSWKSDLKCKFICVGISQSISMGEHFQNRTVSRCSQWPVARTAGWVE